MGSTLTFRFAADDLNHRLITLLKKKEVPHSVDAKGVIHYSPQDEATVENDLIGSVRNSVFSAWQIITCPKEWVERYQQYMTQRGIAFTEEWSNGELWFLLPRRYRPHRWRLPEEAAAATK